MSPQARGGPAFSGKGAASVWSTGNPRLFRHASTVRRKEVKMKKMRIPSILILAALSGVEFLGATLWPTIGVAEAQTVVATIPLGEPAGAGTFAVATNPVTNTVYVTNPGFIGSSPGQPVVCNSYDVSVINGSTNTVLSPITVGLNPFGLAVNPKTNMIYVANIGGAGVDPCGSEPSSTVSVIDGSTNNVVNTVTVGLGPAFVAVNPKTNKIYVTVNGGCCTDGNTVAVIDGSTNTVVDTIVLSDDPFIVAVNPRKNLVYVTHAFADKITVIDGATDTVKATFSIGSEARAIAFDPNGKFVYVAARNTNQLAVVDASKNTVVQYIPVGSRPHGVVFNPDNGRIYVTNRNDGTVSVIDSSTRSVVATVPVGGFPRFLDLNPRTNLLYVPNATDVSVSVIQDEE